MAPIGLDDSTIPDLSEGALLAGRYRIVKPLGQGGMAQVFLAVDERLDRQVAVKAIPRIVYNDIRYRKALEREAKLVMDLHHPRIRAIHNLEEDPQRKAAFLVMEYVEGISLDTLLAYREGERLTEAEAVEVGVQIAEALAHAHGKGILHRDVKPKNVFLAGLKGDAAALAGPLAPGAISVKLADFGLGTLVRESTSQLSGTDLGTSGTLHYMPPEQIKGAEPSPAMDVYGLGATLYEALVGHVLYPRGEALVQILDMAHKPAPLQGVSSAIAAVVDKCLEKETGRRFSSAEEVRGALRHGAAEAPEAQTAAQPPVRAPQAPVPGPGDEAPRAKVEPETRAPAAAPAPPAAPPVRPLPEGGGGVSAPKAERKGRPVGARSVLLILGLVTAVLAGVIYLATRGHSGRGAEVASYGESSGAPGAAGSSAPSAGDARVNPKDGLTYVWIPPGSFQMGAVSGDSDAEGDEKPRHSVTISQGFWMGKTEVTVGAYKRFCSATGRSMPSAPSFNANWQSEDHPIVDVDWNDAKAYCDWVGGRLPTEAEWEYAARAGTDRVYYWGNTMDGTKAWYYGNSGNQTHPVGQKGANGFGLYDMTGNVWEWCSDWYGDSYYGSSPGTDPTGPGSGKSRVVRGGSWLDTPLFLRASARYWGYPGYRYDYIGFRSVVPTR